MARHRRVNKYQRAAAEPPRDITALAHGGARIETRRGAEWYVRNVPSARAVKEYRCPGCETAISAATAHLVVWSADHLFGDEAAVRDRRHWHAHCWRLT